MRNYFAIKCLRLYPPPYDPASFYVVFGADDDSLLLYKRRLETIVGALETRTAPAKIWFELNEEFFVRILNLQAGTVWTQTRLNDLFPVITGAETLYDSTVVDKSPRKVWSNGK